MVFLDLQLLSSCEVITFDPAVTSTARLCLPCDQNKPTDRLYLLYSSVRGVFIPLHFLLTLLLLSLVEIIFWIEGQRRDVLKPPYRL